MPDGNRAELERQAAALLERLAAGLCTCGADLREARPAGRCYYCRRCNRRYQGRKPQ